MLLDEDMAPSLLRKETAYVVVVVGLFLLLPSLQAASTVSTEDLPTERWGSGAATWNGHVYSIGGRVDYGDHPRSLDEVLVATISPNGSLGSWQRTTPLPDVRGLLTAHVWKDYLYVIGGHRIDGQASGESSVWRAEIGANGSLSSWSTQPNLPFSTFHHASIVVGDYLYVVGGSTGWGPRSNVAWTVIQENGEIGSWHTGPSLPHARERHVLLGHEGSLFVIGGTTPDKQVENQILRAEIQGDGSPGTWEPVGSWLDARRLAGYVSTSHGGLILGGLNADNDAVSTITRVNLSRQDPRFGPAGALPDPVHSLAATGTGDRLYALGGKQPPNEPISNVTGIQLNESSIRQPVPPNTNGTGSADVDGSPDDASEDPPSSETQQPMPPLPDTKIGRTLRDHPELLDHADDYAKTSGQLLGVISPTQDVVEDALSIRSRLRGIEAAGFNAWDDVAAKEPTIAEAFEALDRLNDLLTELELLLEDVVSAATGMQTAVTEYREDPNDATEAEVRGAFENSISAYEAAALRLERTAGTLDDASRGLDVAKTELDQHRDKPFIGSSIGSAADSAGSLSSRISGIAEEIREPARQLREDVAIMKEALDEGILGLTAPGGVAALAALAVGAIYALGGRRNS